MKRESKYYCIKTYINFNNEILFEKGKIYNSTDFYDFDTNNITEIGITLENDEYSGLVFKTDVCLKYDEPLLSDYFVSLKSLRKFKLQKLQLCSK
jgi:hypothetical protein